MNDIGKLLSTIRKERKFSQDGLAKKLGMTKQTISNYEQNKRRPDYETLEAICDILNVPVTFFISSTERDQELQRVREAHATSNLPSNVMPIVSGTGQRVRVLGEIAAGKPLYMEEDYETWVDAPMKADFALVVRGDSMYPTYLDGDVVYIKAQPDVDDGQVAAVAVDDSATLKHVYHLTSGINLISDNPAHPPIFVDPADQEIRILGIVVGFTRMYANVNKLAGVSKGMPGK